MRLLRRLASAIGWLVLLSMGLGLVGSIVAMFIGLKGGEQPIAPGSTERSVLVVKLDGEIVSSEKFRKQLDEGVKEKKVRAIVVAIDSPGGAVGASEEIYSAIKRASAVKPVVCSLGSLAASGGLYSAVGCNKIISNKGTLTGSIGVIMMFPGVTDLVSRIGFKMNVIKSGALKDAGMPFHEMRPEEQAYLQSVVNTTYEQFLDVVSTSRNLNKDEVRKFADGRVILGEDALKLGLVDEIGDVYRAGQIALGLAKIEGEPEMIFYQEKKGFLAWLEGAQEAKSFIRAYTEPRLMAKLGLF